MSGRPWYPVEEMDRHRAGCGGDRAGGPGCSAGQLVFDTAGVNDDVDPIPVLDDLSDRERELIESSRRGEVLVCSNLDRDTLAGSDDPAHQVRAELIRELLLGRRGPLDPRGIQVHAARIVGVLDLQYVQATVGLDLRACAITESIRAQAGRLPRLSLSRSRINTLHADGLQVDGDMVLVGAGVTGSGELGARDTTAGAI
jgi:hypothetical protein